MILIICAVFGIICALVAHGKGRSAIGWFVIGFIAPLLGIILVFVLPDQKANERRLDRIGQQNRRLKERLRQTRIVNRRKLEQVNKRLNAHDRSLDLDTAKDEEPSQLEYAEEDDQEDDVQRPASPPRTRGAARQGGAVARPVARPQAPAIGSELQAPPAAQRSRSTVQAPPAAPSRPPIQRRRPS